MAMPRDAHLMYTACNPCMDLVALLCKDNAPANAAVGPPGMTPAQLAMRQRMLAFQARRLGVANPAAGDNGRDKKEPERGDALNLALWRIGTNTSMVWEVAITPPPGLFAGLSEYGLKESVTIGAMHWSPDGAHELRLRLY